MPKTKISEFSATPANNTDIDSINIAEGCAPSGINDAIRELMAQLKDWQSGTSNDPYVVGSSGSLTLSQGTANTVPYLNGSKVVTSGTALQFDGANFGIGVTPSSWRSTIRATQIGQSGSIHSYTNANSFAVSSNAYVDSAGTDKYISTGFSSKYSQETGVHQWYTAASGTAGNTISFTQAMTLDASGSLGIGTTSIADISGGSGKTLEIYGGSQGSFLHLTNSTTGQTISDGFIIGASIGGSDALLIQRESANMIFRTNDTECARFDASGRLLLNCTSPVGSCYTTIQYSAVAFNGLALNQSTNSSGGRFMLFASQGTQCGVIDRVGTTSAVVYTSTSDRRLKQNIVDAPSAISHINAVKVRSYNWIDSGHHVKYGVIAQEFVDVEPDAVVQGDTGQTVEKSWAVDTSALVPAMIKAIQEQQALITQLQADVAALKA